MPLAMYQRVMRENLRSRQAAHLTSPQHTCFIADLCELVRCPATVVAAVPRFCAPCCTARVVVAAGVPCLCPGLY